MREIQFRGRCIETDHTDENGKSINIGDWVYGKYYVELIDIEDNISFEYQHFIKTGYGNHFIDIKINHETIGQYTGLKDNNGKKVFEGDIIRYATDSIDKGNILKWFKISEVINNAPYSFSPWLEGFVIEPEVIGNIFENKDLLK